MTTRFTSAGLVHEHSGDCSHSLDGPPPVEEEEEDDPVGDILARLFWQHNAIAETEEGYRIVGRP